VTVVAIVEVASQGVDAMQLVLYVAPVWRAEGAAPLTRGLSLKFTVCEPPAATATGHPMVSPFS